MKKMTDCICNGYRSCLSQKSTLYASGPVDHAAASSELNSLRNESGGKYHACEKCVHGSSKGSNVYITDQGDRYHNSLTCSGLKRTVYTARISEVPGKRACSKCGGK